MNTRYGITFTRLISLANMPVGRFRAYLRRLKQEREYVQLLQKSCNRNILEKLMCRKNVSIDWDGTLYDCDFNLALKTPITGASTRVEKFSRETLATRRIVTGEHCLGYTAGDGSSCQGALEVASR